MPMNRLRKNIIKMLDFYAEKLPASINLYSMIIPTQIDFMPFYKTVGDDEKGKYRLFNIVTLIKE